MSQTVLLGDIAKVVKGISYRSVDYSEKGEGLAFINLKNVGRGGGFRTDGTKYYKGEYKPGQTVLPGDILVANTDLTQDRDIIGSPIFMPDLGEDACFSLDLSKLEITEPDLIDKNYLFYLLKAPQARHYMISHSNGSTVMHLSVSSIPKMKLNLPDITAQKAAAGFLLAIDEKIELNRKMNQTLEQMGQALFRHYFIDNSESKTWPKGKVSDLGTVITGKTPSKTKSEYFGGDIQFLKVPDMHGHSIVIKTSDSLTKEGAASQKGKLIPKYSTCVSCIATVGLVSLAGSNLQTNQQINSIIPKNQEYKFYNYLVMLDKSELIKTMASGGTATPNLNKGHFENIKVKLPPIDVLAQFDIRVADLFKKIELNMREVENLQELRDSLLPRLISGKVKV